MKRVFLIGDSIRIGYDQYVRENLADCAQLYWVADNARYVTYTLRLAHDWVATDCDPEKLDVIHWNNGLWDIAHVCGDDEVLTTPAAYEDGLRRIARRLKKYCPNAKIIFGLTTSVIEDRMKPTFYRLNADIEAYNDIARRVMAEEGVEVNDLYTVAREMSDDWHSVDGTHYTEEGYQLLAQKVTEAIKAHL